MPKTDERTVTFYCDSGANIHSCHEYEVRLRDLGLDSWDEWDCMNDDDRLNFVHEYFLTKGYPEFGWEE